MAAAKKVNYWTSQDDECESCRKEGAGKGIGDCGHTHCRQCPDCYFHCGSRAKSISRTAPVVGKTCAGNGREAPALFEAPRDIFRKGWRMITIFVGNGDTAETFSVEESLLKHASPYFENALKGTNFQERARGRVVLDDQDPVIFGLLNEFLHLGTIRQHDEIEEAPVAHTSEPASDEVMVEREEARYGVNGEEIPAYAREHSEDFPPIEVDSIVQVSPTIHTSPNMTEFCEAWLLAHYHQINPLLNYAI